MADGVVYASFESMHEFMRLGFIAAGVPAEDAKVCADVLIEADKRGIDSHGVGRFKHIYIDRLRAGIQNPVTEKQMVQSAGSTILKQINRL